MSILNSEEHVIVLKASHVIGILLEVSEADKHAILSKEFMENLCEMLQKNLDAHYELLLTKRSGGEYKPRAD